MQKELKEGMVSEIKPIREGMKYLPTSITFPQFPSLTAMMVKKNGMQS